MADLSGDELKVLCGHFLFQGMDAAAVTSMAGSEGCRLSRVEKGKTIYTPRDYTRALGLLLSGRVQVNKEGFVVSVLGRGALFGAAALYNEEEEYAVTLTALTPCRMAFFSQELMSRIIADHSDVAAAYIRYLSGRIRFLERKLGAVLAPDAAAKLAQYLLERREGDMVALDCSMSGLARRLDLGRTSLYRAFEKLAAAGAIEKKGKLVRILKEDILL